LSEGLVAAKMAIQARDMVVQGDAVADAKASYPRPHFDDCAGGFVSKNARRRDSAVMDLFDVGRADAASGDFDQQFAGLDLRDRQGFQAKVIRAAIDNGGHGVRNAECRIHDR
jgi:ATP-dependent DNA ligase